MLRFKDIEGPRAEGLSISEVDSLYVHTDFSELVKAIYPETPGGVELNIHHFTLLPNRKPQPLVAAYYGSRKLDSGVALTYLRVPVDGQGSALREKGLNKKRLSQSRQREIVTSTENS